MKEVMFEIIKIHKVWSRILFINFEKSTELSKLNALSITRCEKKRNYKTQGKDRQQLHQGVEALVYFEFVVCHASGAWVPFRQILNCLLQNLF